MQDSNDIMDEIFWSSLDRPASTGQKEKDWLELRKKLLEEKLIRKKRRKRFFIIFILLLLCAAAPVCMYLGIFGGGPDQDNQASENKVQADAPIYPATPKSSVMTVNASAARPGAGEIYYSPADPKTAAK